MGKKAVAAGVAVLILVLGIGMASAQAAGEQEGVQPAMKNESNPDWLWGETVSVDAVNKTVTVKYLDYETDQEKQVVVTTNDQTTFENAASLAEIKAGDTLSIDYVADQGKNLAKNISVEASDVSEPTPESVPSESVKEDAPVSPDTEVSTVPTE